MMIRDATVAYIRPESPQLFLLFTGMGEHLTIHPIQFIARTGIGNRNIVNFKDPYKAGYQWGISDRYPSLDGIVEWVRQELPSSFPHVREVFCAGTSGGGAPAIYVGYHLAAVAVWGFAALFPNPESLDQRAVAGDRARMLGGEALAAFHRLRDDLDADLQRSVNLALLNRTVAMIRDTPVATRFHLYYAPTNRVDCFVAESFKSCPTVTLHPVVPTWGENPPETGTLNRPDHLVVSMLDQSGELPQVFRSYL